MKLTEADKKALIQARVEKAVGAIAPVGIEDAASLIDGLKREGIKLALGNPAKVQE